MGWKVFGGTGGGLFVDNAGTSLFSGGGSIFGGNVDSVAFTPKLAEGEVEQGGDEEYLEEEEVVAVYGWKPSVTLRVLDNVTTGGRTKSSCTVSAQNSFASARESGRREDSVK